jgi:putative transposase
MIHTDREAQYCAQTFIEIIRKNKLTRSLGRKENCWDNAVTESLFATLKKPAVNGYKLQNKDQMRMEIFAYSEIYYNRVRGHSANNWVSPVDFEALHNQTAERPALR